MIKKAMLINKAAKRKKLIFDLKRLALFLAFILYLIPVALVQSDLVLAKNELSVLRSEPVKSALPVRLSIPKIKVNIDLENVGLTDKGAVDVPKNFAHGAWFNLSAVPGEIGSAIISGHYGYKNGKPSAFDNLYKLRKGDKLYVEDSDGVSTTFVVRAIRRYNPNAEAPEVFDLKDDMSHLNLITCEGIWDKVLKSYSQRLVIFADKVK